MDSCLPDEGGICRDLLQATSLMCDQNSIGIINKKTSFDKLRATYSGRSIAALWKTAAICMQFSYERYLIGSCLPDEGGICQGLLKLTGLIAEQNSIGIINKKTSFDKLQETYSGRFIAALWKRAGIRMHFRYELYLMDSCLPEGGICRGLLQVTGWMCKQNSIGIINKKTSFDKLHAIDSGRSIAALWKTTAIRMQLFVPGRFFFPA